MVKLGLSQPTSYSDAYRLITLEGTPRQARDFTKVVLALAQDERVQGQELDLTAEFGNPVR